MPCIFCIAVFALLAGAVSAAAIDRIEDDLAKKADGPPKKLAESESVVKWELEVRSGRKKVPVAVTVYRDHGRVRIQILTHELSRKEAEALEDEIAAAIGAEVVSRSEPEDEEKIQAVEDEAEVVEPEKLRATEREKSETAPVQKQKR